VRGYVIDRRSTPPILNILCMHMVIDLAKSVKSRMLSPAVAS
jgi:hypothetical protein